VWFGMDVAGHGGCMGLYDSQVGLYLPEWSGYVPAFSGGYGSKLGGLGFGFFFPMGVSSNGVAKFFAG